MVRWDLGGIRVHGPASTLQTVGGKQGEACWCSRAQAERRPMTMSLLLQLHVRLD